MQLIQMGIYTHVKLLYERYISLEIYLMIIGMKNFYVILWIKKIVLKVLCIKKDVKNVNINIYV